MSCSNGDGNIRHKVMKLNGRSKERTDAAAGQTGGGASRKAVITALSVNVLTALVCIFVFCPVFETNDDNGLIAIACGARGLRDAHLVHSNYLFGRLLTAAYAASAGMPWWSILQVVLLFAAFLLITVMLLKRANGTAWALYIAAVIFFFSYEGYVRMQYTKSAGIICAAGLMAVFYGLPEAGSDRTDGTDAGSTAGKIFTAAGMILTVLGSFYRFQEFLCIVAVFAAMAVYLLLYYIEEKEDAGKYILRAMAAGALLLVLAFGLRAFDRAQYRSQEWADYLEFDKYRTEVLDYGVPDYDKYEKEYNAAGIDRTAYDLMKSWTFQDSEKFTAETFKEIAEFRGSKEMNADLLRGFVKGFAGGLPKERPFLCFLIVLIGWLVLGNHKKRTWISLILLGLIIGALNFYLYYAGRFMVNRVDTGIWFSAVLMLLYWYCPEEGSSRPEPSFAGAAGADHGLRASAAFRNAVLAGLFVLVLAVFAVRVPWQNSLKQAAGASVADKMSERASIERIGSDKEHLYLTKVGTLKFSEAYGPFDALPYKIADNIYPLGGWGSETPTFKSVLRSYGVDNPFRDMIGNDSIYLVDNDIDGTLAYLRKWYKPDAEAELVDDINGHKIYSIR